MRAGCWCFWGVTHQPMAERLRNPVIGQKHMRKRSWKYAKRLAINGQQPRAAVLHVCFLLRAMMRRGVTQAKTWVIQWKTLGDPVENSA